MKVRKRWFKFCLLQRKSCERRRLEPTRCRVKGTKKKELTRFSTPSPAVSSMFTSLPSFHSTPSVDVSPTPYRLPSDPEAHKPAGMEEKLRRPIFAASLSSPSPRSNPTRRRPIKHDSWVCRAAWASSHGLVIVEWMHQLEPQLSTDQSAESKWVGNYIWVHLQAKMSNICSFQLRKGPVRRTSRDLRGQKCNVMLIIVFFISLQQSENNKPCVSVHPLFFTVAQNGQNQTKTANRTYKIKDEWMNSMRSILLARQMTSTD